MDPQEELLHLRERADNAQRLANMGDYDWDIVHDVNRWSDQLYRIFGLEPQSENMSYESYLALVHPEDRAWLTEVHQRSYATGEAYEMTHRILTPDGSVRFLLCNGQVVMDETGSPVQMRGTSIDITERVEAEQEREVAFASLREAQLRRAKSVEINDNVVQGLASALYAMELGDIERAQGYLQRSLDAARDIMTDLVAPLDGVAETSSLVRSTPADVSPDPGGS